MNPEPPRQPTAPALPPCARHFWAFGFLNAVCFTIALGSPMVLCARHLGAGESLVGVLLALTPLFTTLQLPAARYVERWGSKRLMMAGWRYRAFAVLAMSPLPLLRGHVPASLLLFLFTAMSVTFNAIRGFASGSWHPWVKHAIAPQRLGLYFSIEAIVANVACLATLLLGGWVLGHEPAGWRYAVLLLVSGTAGVVSVVPLNRAPDRPPPEGGAAPEPLLAVARRVWDHAAYRRLVRFTIVNSFAQAPVGGFLVLFLKEVVGLPAGLTVAVTSAGLVGSMAGAYALRRLLDRVGSRPVMRVAGSGHLVFYAFWLVYAVFPHPALPLVLSALVLGGVLGASGGIAAGRLILNTCPSRDVTVATAMWQVGSSLSAGLATVMWGFILEWLRAPEVYGPHSHWPFVVFFAGTWAMVLAAQILLRRVREDAALPTGRFLQLILWDWPSRAWEFMTGGRDEDGHDG